MSKDLPPSRTAEQFVVRFPDGMRDRIAAAAKTNNRSMNAEIVSRLQDSFDENFVTVIEARAKPGPESKHFEFNADEIAEKVVARLERIGNPSPNKVILGNNNGVIKSLESTLEAAYLAFAAAALGHEMPAEADPKPIQKGPQRSTNARKPRPR